MPLQSSQSQSYPREEACAEEGIKGAGVQESETEGRRKQVCEEAESLGDRHHTLNHIKHLSLFQKRPPEYHTNLLNSNSTNQLQQIRMAAIPVLH